MRGSPLRELVVCLAAALGLLLPMTGLLRTRVDVPAAPAGPVESPEVEAWIEVRFSHAPDVVELRQGKELLWTGGGAPRDDGYVRMNPGPGAGPLILRVEWPPSVEQAYGELAVEPEGFRSWTAGFWGSSGPVERAWTPEWEEAP